jgi:hypothetical protein
MSENQICSDCLQRIGAVKELEAELDRIRTAAQAVVDEIDSNMEYANLESEDYPKCKYCGERQCDCDTL